MLLKYCPLLLLAQFLIAAASPTNLRLPESGVPLQKELERQAKAETINLLNSLFRSQIAYFTEVKAALNPQTKRSQHINLYITRLNAAIEETDMDEKNKKWMEIFDEFSASPLLINREAETGLTDLQYKQILTGQKLKDISAKFVTDVADYFWKITKLSGRVVSNELSNADQS
ncbi:uncharacterized protein LOC108098327 [Drosophila ficusphila]|uniref:uncharacterized protein LOC108098327 n=1 Tax=Drosophila ficusphila TaxID=30025 RepID=UPI0007E68FBD|nr:uncharacterized protein LOC108098327 [Drosophila ficusphila]